MIGNPINFKSIIINRLVKLKESYKLLIDNYELGSLHFA